MTSEHFETKKLRDWDRHDLLKKNKIVLLVHNCPTHPKVTDLKSVAFASLPPNTISF